MKKIRSAWLTLFFCSAASQAGYFELTANGSYFKYNNGIQDGEPSSTTTVRLGGGLAYRFFANTAIEFSYLYSRTNDDFGQNILSQPSIFYINKVTELQNYSLNLVLHFTDRKSTFRPYILAGGGYMVRKMSLGGRAVDKITNASSTLSFTPQADLNSVSADGGMGLSIFIMDQIALETSFVIYATDLDKSEIFLHYSFTGGMRFLF